MKRKTKLRIVRQDPHKHELDRFERFSEMLADLRMREYFSSDKLHTCDLLCELRKQNKLMLERIVDRRRLRFLSIDGTLPADSRHPAKRVVLA